MINNFVYVTWMMFVRGVTLRASPQYLFTLTLF